MLHHKHIESYIRTLLLLMHVSQILKTKKIVKPKESYLKNKNSDDYLLNSLFNIVNEFKKISII